MSILKNHCDPSRLLKALGFNVPEIVQELASVAACYVGFVIVLYLVSLAL